MLTRYLAPKVEETSVHCRKLHKRKHHTIERGRNPQILAILPYVCSVSRMECIMPGIPRFPTSERSKRVVVSVLAIEAHEEWANSYNSFLTSANDGHERSASHPDRFIPRKWLPVPTEQEPRVGPTASTNVLEKRKIPSLAAIRFRIVQHAVHALRV